MASSSGISACWPPMNQRMASDMSCGLDGSWKTLPPSASRSEMCRWPLWPGTLLDHLAMKVAIRPWRCASTLAEGLEQRRAVGGFEGIAVAQRGFEHAGPGLRVQALDRKAHGFAELEQLMVEIRMHGASQHRVAEGSRRHGLQLPIALLAHGLRRLLEQEELEFRGGADARVPWRPPARARAAARRAGRPIRRLRRIRRGTSAVLGSNGMFALGLRQHPHHGVGIGGVPAGEVRVVVQLIVRVPAQDHVAEPEMLVERRQELVAARGICRAGCRRCRTRRS